MGEGKFIGRDLIEKIEDIRRSKVIVYFTGDRVPFSARIAEDAVRPLYDHLLELDFDYLKEKDGIKRIDLFLYSRGGDISVPWRIVSMIREFCDEFNVLIPYKAQSAATLLSLGADNIVMGRKAELGPIDPTLERVATSEGVIPPKTIAVEDVNSFLSFIKERANINDQEALASVVNNLIKEIGSLALGRVNRAHHHIRLVARKLLTTRREKMDEEKISTIIETLTEKIYSHGHAIARREAKDIGLPVVYPDSELENLMWQLYLRYEKYLGLRDPLYPEVLIGDKEEYEIKDLPIAVIESRKKLHLFKTNVKLIKKRQVPPNPQININLAIQLPPGIRPEDIPQKTRQVLNSLLSQIGRMLPELVRQELIRQSPVIGIEGRVYGGRWVEEA
ncbi:MAG: hypothetical protein DRJ38_10690 [Thermoprotei archaeon]|nr:MAG: hypothetical protein DRJ38_10690 [Thermoprotei archaeon]